MDRSLGTSSTPRAGTIDAAPPTPQDNSLRTAFGFRLRTLRHHRLMSQRALASASGVSLNTIGSIERGLRFPSPEVLEALAQALQVEVRDLFDVGEHSTPATLEGAARELCRVLEGELMPEFKRLSILAERLLAEVESRQTQASTSNTSTGQHLPATAA